MHIGVLFFIIASMGTPSSAFAAVATTTITVSICGNGVIDTGELCDGGIFNDGAYSSSTAQRHCTLMCSAYGPYCGDGTLQALYGEQCDDGNNTDGDLCSASCTQESAPISTTTPPVPPPPPPVPSSSGGAGGAFTGTVPIRAQTRVILEGKAYPSVSVNVLKDGVLVGVIQTDAFGKFSYEASDLTPGHTTFGFWALDSRGVRSITLTTTFQVTQNAVTTVSNIFLPPTIDLKSKRVKLDELLDVFGFTAPNVKVSVFINKENTTHTTATSSSSGLWSASVPLGGLQDEAFHTVKSMFEELGGGIQAKSGLSQSVNFYIGIRDVGTPGTGDLTGDSKVSLVDFSILLFHWGTDHAVADLNGDGRVNLTDLSILLFNWTG
jgi:cysteine-rich repeat protein